MLSVYVECRVGMLPTAYALREAGHYNFRVRQPRAGLCYLLYVFGHVISGQMEQNTEMIA